MNENLALWHAVERTDPAHVKAITGKAYRGNSPKPHYLIHKATETFGPCGLGWGFDIVEEKLLDGALLAPGFYERIHTARVRVWYEWGGKRGTVEHVGQTAFCGKRKSGDGFTDEDAPKKSVTDALIKALSMIGFAGDIFMGRFDDSKYVNDLRREIADEERNGNDDRFVPNAAARKTTRGPDWGKPAAAKRNGDWEAFQADLMDAQSAVSLQRLRDDYVQNKYPNWTPTWRENADEEFEKRLAQFSQGDALQETMESLTGEPQTRAEYIQTCHDFIAAETNESVLMKWWQGEASARRRFSLNPGEVLDLKNRVIERRKELTPDAPHGRDVSGRPLELTEAG